MGIKLKPKEGKVDTNTFIDGECPHCESALRHLIVDEVRRDDKTAYKILCFDCKKTGYILKRD